MSRHQPGTRVAAIRDGDETTIYLFGFGEYIGDTVPHDAAGWMADALKDAGLDNPTIRLDSGKLVYGCECWWGPEEVVRERYKDFTFVEVDIDDARKAVE